ncbi:MAG: NAD(P)/FAD-dependent oxidoreductase [Chloroflexi bacterium]|nr:NAD(P)/FAD-dependent oxidoreductase [Chloroflexota bacterium]
MSGKTILILGGGVGGLVAANELRQRLPRQHRIVLVEKNAQHAFAPSFLWLMTGDRQPAQITREVRQLVRPGVEVVIDAARAIDLASQRVETSTQTLNYDYLIVALGAELAPEAIPGLDTAHTYYTIEGATKLRNALQQFDGGTIAVVVSALPYKCPGAPHEGAMLIADSFRRRGIRDKVAVHLFTPEPQPMPVAGPALGDAVRQMLDSQGIVFHALRKLTSVNPQTRELFFENQASFKYDMLVAIPPHRGPRLAREAGLANEAGWIPVDRATLATKYENVFALGDVTAISIPGRWKPDVPLMLPKAGVFAHAQAEVVARRIAAEVAGARAQDSFYGHGYCMLEAGESIAGFAFGNFFGEPSPQVELRRLGKAWHWGKILFEQWWLTPYGAQRVLLGWTLDLASKTLGIPGIV